MGGRAGGTEGRREGGRAGGRAGGREGGRDGGREGRRADIACQHNVAECSAQSPNPNRTPPPPPLLSPPRDAYCRGRASEAECRHRRGESMPTPARPTTPPLRPTGSCAPRPARGRQVPRAAPPEHASTPQPTAREWSRWRARGGCVHPRRTSISATTGQSVGIDESGPAGGTNAGRTVALAPTCDASVELKSSRPSTGGDTRSEISLWNSYQRWIRPRQVDC